MKDAVKTKKKFAFDVGWVFISQIITLATGFLLSVILGRFLGAAAFGLFTMTLTIYTIASLVGGIGIPTAIVKYVAEFKEEKEKLDIFVSCGVVNSIVFGAIIGSILFALSGVLASAFSMPELTDLIKIIAFALPFLVVNNTLLGLLNGLREMKSYSFRTVIRSVLLIGFTILLIHLGLGIEGAVLALLLSEVGTLFLLIYISRNFFCFVIQDYVKTTKEVVKFGSQLFLANAIWMANTNADKLLIGYFLMDKDVGIYTIALAIASGLLMIPGAIGTITYPAISEYNSTGQYEAIETLINKSMKYSLVILSILGISIIVFSTDIILFLLTPEFLPAVTPLTILIFGMVFFGAWGAVGSAFSGVGRADIAWKICSVDLFVGLTLDLLLIPSFGICGAAIGTAGSLLTEVILSIILLKKVLNIRIQNIIFIKVIASVGVVFLLILVFEKLVNHYISGIFIILLYISLLILTNIITLQDLKEIHLIVKPD
uniref:Lipid II flippase MurJ n=1 Tax=Candidatus Methanogaster sp. ANME-2c ERB4 TaxID=2759911 RepID=A0A7G9Y191_9EURY|nr:lipid II flippase MurJ [Methanosarcinales archaeon ANME-2c ERB4]QNO42752.1 lipid II flippase MurJ [Methanosarcinales archaeon ANME-2c ERB4]